MASLYRTTAIVAICCILGLTGFASAQTDPLEPTSPTPPWGLIATASEDGVTLEWNEPLTSGSAPVEIYRVYRIESPENVELIAEVSKLTYLDEETEPDPIHGYGVTAVSPDGESQPALALATSYPYCWGISVIPPQVSTNCFLPPPVDQPVDLPENLCPIPLMAAHEIICEFRGIQI